MSILKKLEFIDQINEFASMPQVILQLMEKINQPDISHREVETVINQDPSLVTYILKITNSLLFGLREEVETIKRAIALLGDSNLKSLLTSYAIRNLCSSIRDPDAQKYIWEHSLQVGVLSKLIAERITGQEQPEAYTRGLLHDMGKIVMYTYSSSKFLQSVDVGIMNNMDFVYSELQLFGFSHIETGYVMMQKLRFPKGMRQMVLFHHDPEFSSSDSIDSWVVALANEMAHHLFDVKQIDIRRYMTRIDLTKEDFNWISEAAHQQFENYKEIM